MIIDIDAIETEITEGTLVPTSDELSGMSAYKVGVILNETLEALAARGVKLIERNKPYTTQHIYTYGRNGSIDGVKHESMTSVRFTDEQVEKFIKKMVSRNLVK